MTTDQINAIGKWVLLFALLGGAAYFATHDKPHSDDYALGCGLGALWVFILGIL